MAKFYVIFSALINFEIYAKTERGRKLFQNGKRMFLFKSVLQFREEEKGQ